MPRDNPSYVLFLLSCVFAFAMSVVPLPDSLAHFRPEMVCLTMFYWVLIYPQNFGILTCWIVGLLWDVLLGTPLGIHGLALSLQGYLVLMMVHRLGMYPVVQQSFFVFMVVGIVLMLYRWLNGMIEHATTDLGYLFGALTSALLWPPYYWLLRKFDHG